jgi:uncharacterized protein YbaR (Trm112 family)
VAAEAQTGTMETIACPVCVGPLTLRGTRATCPIGHKFKPDELQAGVEEEAARALWAAVRSLEDTASGARWRATLPDPPPHLETTIARATHHALLLRDLIARREGGTSDTDNKPEHW